MAAHRGLGDTSNPDDRLIRHPCKAVGSAHMFPLKSASTLMLSSAEGALRSMATRSDVPQHAYREAEPAAMLRDAVRASRGQLLSMRVGELGEHLAISHGPGFSLPLNLSSTMTT